MRASGAKGRILFGATSGATATTIAYQRKWTIQHDTEFVDLTVNGDHNKVWGSRNPEITGTFEGFFDTATAQTYTAATDGLSRRFYLYPTSASRPYFFGTAVFDFNGGSDVNDAASVSASWEADSSFWKVSTGGSFTSGFSAGFEL